MCASQAVTLQVDDLPGDDGELILEIQQDPTRFHLVYDRWAVRIFQYFFHRTGEEKSAEDLTSQLFLAAYQALPRYRHRGHFPAWLFTIARNLLKEYYRKNRREVPLETAQHLVSKSDPPDEYTRVDEIGQLKRLVASLPDEDQELIRLRYVAELSFADMAVVLNKRQDAVKKSLYRLQARLQSLLEQNDD